MIRRFLASFLATAVIACTRPAPPQPRAVIVNNSCAPRPASWAKSQVEVALGQRDTTLDPGAGTLIVDIGVDSMPRIRGGQVSLLRGRRAVDARYADSAIRVTVPAGRYLLRARRIGAQTLLDSIDVRQNFVDTVKVVLGREVVCLNTQVLAK